ncbi:MAG: hypothetical protein H6581_10970 [Bacteroidia bacterium]|nr:hypothetical protein [Bacteroidia bacterium]
MTPERTLILRNVAIAGIAFFLLVLAFSPFMNLGSTIEEGYRHVLVEYSISKDFYSSQGRSFVDAEHLEKFVGKPRTSQTVAVNDPHAASSLDSTGDEK